MNSKGQPEVLLKTVKRRCSLCATVLSLVLLAASTAVSTSRSQQAYTCPLNCSCELSQIACVDWLPQVLSDIIEEVVVICSPNQYWTLLYPGMFCNVTWNNVHKLTLTLGIRGHWSRNTMFIAVHNLFLCLEKIQTLKLRNIIPSTLSGLPNVTYLSISTISDKYLLYYLRLPFLSDMENVPKLTHFRYSWRPKLHHHALVFNDEFIRALCSRPIQILDFSSIIIRFNFTNLSKSCQTLTTLILRDSEVTIDHQPNFWDCPKLLFVDLSGVNYFQDYFKGTCDIYHVYISLYRECLLSTNVLYMNRMVPSSLYTSLTNCVCLLNDYLLEFHFTHNVLPTFIFSFDAMSLRYINLSNNYIETLNPSVFTNLPSLRKIDLSGNNLHQIGILDHTVPSLFKQNLNLRRIDLSSNKLSSLPSNTFASNNNLEEIIISNNSFTQISFNISTSYNLTLLDFRVNDIQNFDSNSRQAFEALYELQQQRLTYSTSNKSLQVLLEGNPFTCRCHALDFFTVVCRISNV